MYKVHHAKFFDPSLTQDVFVTALDRSTGQPLWTQQLDTRMRQVDHRDDSVAAMEINPQTGTPHVLLTSMNLQNEWNDIFLLDLQPEDGANDLTGSNLDMMIDDAELEGAMGLGNDVTTTTNNDNDDDNEDMDEQIIAVAIVVPLVLFFAVFGMQYMMYRTDIEATGKRCKPEEEEIQTTAGHEVL